MGNLIDGVYDPHIAGYQVIDCRFDYEYAGGHIQGAINVGNTTAIEELLLSGSLPEPSCSGDGGSPKTILIFHCEFSRMRAPTM